MKILHHDTSDIEKVIAKSNHLQALSLKGAALRYPGWGRRAWKTKNGGHGVTLSSGSGEGGREELEISRVNTQRNQKLEKIAHSAERFLITAWNSGDSESGVGHVVVLGGVLGLDPSGWAQITSGGMLGEEGDRRRLQQRVCKWMDTGTVGSGRTQLGKGQFGGHTTTVTQEAQKGPKP